MLLQLIELISLLFAIGYLVHEYSDKLVGRHIKLLSFIAWLLSFGFVFIVPLDIYWVRFDVFKGLEGGCILTNKDSGELKNDRGMFERDFDE